MCGRFTLTVDPGQFQDQFPSLEVPQGFAPRYNIAPTQPVAVVPNDGSNRVDYYVWGLIPFWAKDPEIGNRMINARAETLTDKPAFKGPFRYKRCLVLADGFYEWRKEPDGKTKTPIYIQLKSGQPFGFAGLWDSWHAADGSEIRSCTIITTRPNTLLEAIHNRMPVILHPEAYAEWLTPGEGDPARLKQFLLPYPDGEMVAFPVSRLVNTPQNDSPECILPVA
jgi:putative SOS response-associated peptidase YedK